MTGLRHEVLLAEIAAEFPRFAILPKRSSGLQRAIGGALAVLTLGGQRSYMTRYHTMMFGKLYVPETWQRMNDAERYVLLRHERVHLRQAVRMGNLGMAVVYLFPLFPLFLAWGRARIEWEAYEETLRATAEVYGIGRARALEDEIVRRFVGPDYGWMWPFPGAVRRWVRDFVGALERAGVGAA